MLKVALNTITLTLEEVHTYNCASGALSQNWYLSCCFFLHFQSQIEENENSNTVIANFHCRRCGQGFMTEIELGKHLREHINPPGSGRKGRLPKVDKLSNFTHKRRTVVDKSEKDEEENIENDEDFQPKSYQIIKQEPSDTPRLRILPRRSLKGKRTTGFLVDSEFVLPKHQIKTEPEEPQEEIHVIIERKDASPMKRRRGRPKTKNVTPSKDMEISKRRKIFENNEKSSNNTKQSEESPQNESGDLENNDHNETDLRSKTKSPLTFKDKKTGKSFSQSEILSGVLPDFNKDPEDNEGVVANTNDYVLTPANKAANNSVNPVNETTLDNSSMNSTIYNANGLLSSTVTEGQVSIDSCSIQNTINTELGDNIMDNPPLETIDINICPEDGSQNRENLKVLNIDGPNDELGSRMNDTVSDENGDEKSVKFNSRIETENDEMVEENNEIVEEEDKTAAGGKTSVDNDENIKESNEDVHCDNSEENRNSDKNDMQNNEKSEKRKRRRKSLPIPMEIRHTPNGKIYFCTICNKKFYTERYLRLHAPMHTNQFKCDICDKTFARKESMQKHECRVLAKIIIEEEEHEQNEEAKKVYRCSNCNETFEDYDDAEHHLRVHRKGFQCEHCNSFFVKRVQFNQHICPKLEESRYSCDICAQTFGNEQNLFRHIAMHTDIFKCEGCEKCFSRKDSLIRHVTKCCPEKAGDYGVFSCKKCSKTFGTKLGLENHEFNCDMHLCEVCLQVYDSEKNLTLHKCKPPPENSDPKSKCVKFSCTDCSKSFKNLHYLLQHKKVHCSSYECKICLKKLKSPEERDDHERFCIAVNAIKLDGKISCDRCGIEFFLAKEYKEHYQTHTHTFHCEKCDRRFIKIGTLHNHQCSPPEGFQCSYCSREFKTQRFYQNHMNTHLDFLTQCSKCNQFIETQIYDEHECENVEPTVEDESGAKYVCHFCGKNFVSTSNLNKHIKVHGEKNIECEFCGKKFHYPEYLKVHIAGVHEKKNQFQCSECGKILTSKPGLVSHIKLFHAENKDVYPCPECGKFFSQKGNMKTHMFSHGKERTFQCTFCTKAFKYPDQLNRHKLLHTVGNKFQCEICEKTFVKDYELKKHLQANHSNKMYVCEFCGSRCGHRHTVQRHYRRKHPASAELVESPQYLDSLFQEVEIDTMVTEKNEMLLMKHTANVQQPNGMTVTVPIEEIVSHSAAETLSSLSAAGNTQAVISNEVAQLISQDGTIIQIPGQDNMFTIPSNQEGDGDDNQQTVVILQIVNPQEQQIEVTELETHVINTTEIETINQDVTNFQYAENILHTS